MVTKSRNVNNYGSIANAYSTLLKNEDKTYSNSILRKVGKKVAVVGLASMLYLIPNLNAQSISIDQKVQTELTDLAVKNGGQTDTISSYVNGTRSDGVTLGSTVQQLESAPDAPSVLKTLLNNYNTPKDYTVYQGFIHLYNQTSESSTARSLTNSVEQAIAKLNVSQPALGFQSCGGILNSTINANGINGQETYNLSNEESTISIKDTTITASYDLNGAQINYSAELLPSGDIIGPIYAAGGKVTVTPIVGCMSTTLDSKVFGFNNPNALQFSIDESTPAGSVIMQNYNVTYKDSSKIGIDSAISADWNSASEAITEVLYSIYEAAQSGIPVVAAETTMGPATISLSSTTQGTLGSKTYPFMPDQSGNMPWQGPGYYDLTIAENGNPAGIYYVSNKAFIAVYDQNLSGIDLSSTMLSSKRVNELIELDVLSGGNATTIPSIINDYRADGLNLRSTVGQLETATDAPKTLSNLLVKYLFPSNMDLQQALVDLYLYTAGSIISHPAPPTSLTAKVN